MVTPTRNRAPLAGLMGQALSVDLTGASNTPISQQALSSQPQQIDYSQIIDDVRQLAEKRSTEYGQAAHGADFIDFDHMTQEQTKRVLTATRQANPEALKKYSDGEILESLAAQTAASLPGSNIIIYSPGLMKGYSSDAAEFIFAHELGHNILGLRGEGIGPEPSADHIAAEIVGPQKAVNALAEMAQKQPTTNNIAYIKKYDHNQHKTDYHRALDIQKAFPHEKIDLSHFPKPEKNYIKPKQRSGSIAAVSSSAP